MQPRFFCLGREKNCRKRCRQWQAKAEHLRKVRFPSRDSFGDSPLPGSKTNQSREFHGPTERPELHNLLDTQTGGERVHG